MTIIVGVVVVWTLITVGALVGVSVYRERHRRGARSLDAERRELRRERADFEERRRLLDR